MNVDSFHYYQYCLSHGRPYFGRVMWAGQGHPIRHAYMQVLIERLCRRRGGNPFKVLEIGSWAGGSAITWAEGIRKFNRGRGLVICLDPWKLYFDPCRYSELPGESQIVYREMAEALKTGGIFDLFLHNIRATQQEDLIVPMRGSSHELLPLFCDEWFDLIFVDGDHTYARVTEDLKNSAPLVAEGGVICGDDLELQISQIDLSYALAHKQMDYIRDPQTKVWYHPGVTLAVGELAREVSAWEGFWAMRKAAGNWEKVELEKLRPGEICIPQHLRLPEPGSQNPPGPRLVKEGYRGFNFVLYGEMYYGLAQSLGPVDVTQLSESTVRIWERKGLCRVGSSAEELQESVDRLR
jgi:predicted O-methyltransferase YrrM